MAFPARQSFLRLREVTIEIGILERDCGLQCQQLQYRGSTRCEDAGSEIVLKIERAGLGLEGVVKRWTRRIVEAKGSGPMSQGHRLWDRCRCTLTEPMPLSLAA